MASSRQQEGPHCRLYDEWVVRFGLMRSVVLSQVYRFQRMRHGACEASVATLAARCGLSERKIQQELRGLIDAGIVVVVRPEAQHRARTLLVTIRPSATQDQAQRDDIAEIAMD